MKQSDLLAGLAIVMFLISIGITVTMWAKAGSNWIDPSLWWIAACINAHSIISRLAMRD
jgi:predicted cobalt transporter CbtA